MSRWLKPVPTIHPKTIRRFPEAVDFHCSILRTAVGDFPPGAEGSRRLAAGCCPAEDLQIPAAVEGDLRCPGEAVAADRRRGVDRFHLRFPEVGRSDPRESWQNR